MEPPERIYPMLILYGTQKGVAKEVAERIGKMGKLRAFDVTVMSMDAYNMTALQSMRLVVFVVATAGDGEVPDNMKVFWDGLLKKSLPADFLKGVSTAVFGLGDSSYANYNVSARKLHVRLLQLGANEVVERGLGDDQHEKGYMGGLDPWLESLWRNLSVRYPLPEGYTPDDTPKLQRPLMTVEYTNETRVVSDTQFYEAPKDAYNIDSGPILAEVKKNERLTDEKWGQDVRHMELIADACRVKYNAGDIAVIYPENTGGVEEVISLLSLDANAWISIQVTDDSRLPTRCSIWCLFQNYLDILGTPRRCFFEQLLLFANSEEERDKLLELSSADGADFFHEYCTREKRTYVEVLRDFPSCRPPLDYILEMIPPIQPRLYSIASSAYKFPGVVHLCVAIVNFKSPWNRVRTGVCTSWLKGLTAGMGVKMWIKPGRLHLPTDSSSPLIMIGPGTGIAPMRGIIQERFFVHGDTENHLFFGCRHEDKDFLYGEELRSYETFGSLKGLFLAFSRDQDHKIYVQTRLLQHKKLIWQLVIEKGAYIYISGSAKRMPTDVFETLRLIVSSEGNMSEKQAQLILKRLQRTGRYVVESWS